MLQRLTAAKNVLKGKALISHYSFKLKSRVNLPPRFGNSTSRVFSHGLEAEYIWNNQVFEYPNASVSAYTVDHEKKTQHGKWLIRLEKMGVVFKEDDYVLRSDLSTFVPGRFVKSFFCVSIVSRDSRPRLAARCSTTNIEPSVPLAAPEIQLLEPEFKLRELRVVLPTLSKNDLFALYRAEFPRTVSPVIPKLKISELLAEAQTTLDESDSFSPESHPRVAPIKVRDLFARAKAKEAETSDCLDKSTDKAERLERVSEWLRDEPAAKRSKVAETPAIEDNGLPTATIESFADDVPLEGARVMRQPRRLYVKLSSTGLSDMEVETFDMVQVPTYSQFAVVKYPVYHFGQKKLVPRYAHIWDQIMPIELVRYLFGFKPKVTLKKTERNWP